MAQLSEVNLAILPGSEQGLAQAEVSFEATFSKQDLSQKQPHALAIALFAVYDESELPEPMTSRFGQDYQPSGGLNPWSGGMHGAPSGWSGRSGRPGDAWGHGREPYGRSDQRREWNPGATGFGPGVGYGSGVMGGYPPLADNGAGPAMGRASGPWRPGYGAPGYGTPGYGQQGYGGPGFGPGSYGPSGQYSNGGYANGSYPNGVGSNGAYGPPVATRPQVTPASHGLAQAAPHHWPGRSEHVVAEPRSTERFLFWVCREQLVPTTTPMPMQRRVLFDPYAFLHDTALLRAYVWLLPERTEGRSWSNLAQFPR